MRRENGGTLFPFPHNTSPTHHRFQEHPPLEQIAAQQSMNTSKSATLERAHGAESGALLLALRLRFAQA